MQNDSPILDFTSPWMNSAGSLGFAPDPYGDVDLKGFGAFVTNPISLRARKAAQGQRLIPFPGGELIHTGHPNSGLPRVIRDYADTWARSRLPIIIHLLSAETKQLRTAMARIEDLENILAVEISIEDESTSTEASQLIKAAVGELPVIAHLPVNRASELADAAMQAGASVISLAAPRGTLADKDGNLINGRLFGPSVYPIAMDATRSLIEMKVPVIASGGIETKDQGQALLSAGAMAVQIDVALWKGFTTTS